MVYERPLTQHINTGSDPLDLKEYERNGGYVAVRKALKQMSPKQVQQLVQDSNLKGRGGAGFNTGMKWSFGQWETVRLILNTLFVMLMKWSPAHLKTGYCLKEILTSCLKE